MNKKNIIIITGATGSGKSKLAIEIAKNNNGEIINADSMQIYKQIPIISAQPNEEEKKIINHHMYGFLDITKTSFNYSVGNYLHDLQNTIKTIIDKNKTPIIVGGTMLYIDAIINGINEIEDIKQEIKKEVEEKFNNKQTNEIFDFLQSIDEKYAKIVDKNNKARLIRGIEVKLSSGKSIIDFWDKKNKNFFTDEFNFDKYIIEIQREKLYERINQRFDKMLDLGAIDEIKNLFKQCKVKNIDLNKIPKAIGLHEFFDYFENKISLEKAIELSKQHSRNYAKRQLTWFRNRFQDFKKIQINY